MAFNIIVASMMFSRYQLFKKDSIKELEPCPAINDSNGITRYICFEILFHTTRGTARTVIANIPPNDKNSNSFAGFCEQCNVPPKIFNIIE